MGAPSGGFKRAKAATLAAVGKFRHDPWAMQLHVRRDGNAQVRPATPAAIDRAFTGLVKGRKAQIGLQHEFDILVGKRGASGGWRFLAVDRSGDGAIGHRWSARADLDDATARRLIDAYAVGDPSWRVAIAWKRGFFGQSPALLIPLILFGAATAALLVMAATGQLKGWSWRYAPNLVVGIGMIASVIVYIDQFFRRLRPRLARRIGRWLGLTVIEEHPILGRVREGGFWASADGRPLSNAMLTVLDALILLFGLIVPIFVFGAVVVLAARPILA